MSSDARLRFLLDMIGGEQNLPPQLPAVSDDKAAVAADGDEEEEQGEEPPPIVRDSSLIPPSQLEPAVQPDCLATTPTLQPDRDGVYPLNSDGCKGEHAPRGISFTPFNALTKYCYKFVPRQWMQRLASAFFDQDKIYQREWDLYYINSDYSGVLLFVAEHQLQSLITDIDAVFPSAGLSIGDEERTNHLVIDFEDLPDSHRPRWLGRCNSRAQHNSWLSQLRHEAATMIPDSGDRSLAAFKTKIDEAREANSKKNKAFKAFKRQETLVRRQDMVRQTLRAQRYLGMVPKSENSLLPDIGSLEVSALDSAHPVQYSFDNEPVFIAIDVEAWEKPPRMVTEIGVATLDTRDLKEVAPGATGEDWHKQIRGRHFRVLEYKDLVNHEYVQGCPDAFEFGESELVAKDSVASVLASCFREPYSKKQSINVQSGEPESRNIVVVGHDLSQDVQYCQQFGFSIFNRGNIIDTMDTSNLYRAYSKNPNPASLGNILYEFDIRGWHLHNAGNDAVYTLQAMLAICVKMSSHRGSDDAAKERESKFEQREETLVQNAKERAKEDFEGWDSIDGDDGGVALPPCEEDFRPKPKAGTRREAKRNGESGLYTLMGNPLDV